MYKVKVIDLVSGKAVLEFEVRDGEFPSEEIGREYGKMMWGPNSKSYRVQIESTFR